MSKRTKSSTEKRVKTPGQYQHRSLFFTKLFLGLGCILAAFYVIDNSFLFSGLSESVLGIILAFAILMIGFGLISYFFCRLFTKLCAIADDVENEHSSIYNED